MTREIDIVAMNADHLDQIAALERVCFPDPWSRRMLAEELENECASFLVAVDEEGNVAGYAGVHVILDEAYIANIAVRPDRQGMGYGEQVTRAMIQLAADSGMSWMTLEVRRSNVAAQSLYHKLGFIDVGYRKRYYENSEDALIMALEHLPEGNPENDPMLVRE